MAKFESKSYPNILRLHWMVLLTVCFDLNLKSSIAAEDWGSYSIVPSSATGFVLEAVGSQSKEGAVVSINKPMATENQKWVIVARGKDRYLIKPSLSSTLVLAASEGGKKMGTAIVLEKENGKPWQEWSLKKNENGSYCIIPAHAPGLGLDHFGGKAAVGARVDLWENRPGDQHLEWFIKPLAGTEKAIANGILESPPSTYVAPEIQAEKILKGQLKSFTFNSSKIFPGTVREVNVFIPAQYNGAKPACVYVKTDGFNPKEQELMEKMIATKEMPVTIGIFVRPGDLPAPMKNTMGRRNRCLEYDGMGDNHVRFLLEELLPYIAKEYQLKLSDNGDDRCIAGGSSGGIAAFNAAWERPEAFSRVYANSGSFVAFRGGHEFPTLVRKFEAKPIRAYLTTGMHDMENCAGDWFLIDLEMDKALKFSGYDYKFRVIKGGHVAGYYDYYEEAMSYLWKDWPKPVKAGPSAPRVQDIILPNESWKLVAQGLRGITSSGVTKTGEVLFLEADANKILRYDLEGNITLFTPNAEQASCMCVGAQGEIYVGSKTSGKILKIESNGERSVLVEGLPPQQLLAMPDGSLYATSNDAKLKDSGSIWLVKAGKKTQVDSGLKYASGLAYRPDQWLLSAADGRSKWGYSFQIRSDGSLINKEKFFWLHVPDWEDDSGAESMCYTKEGPLLIATHFGVQACADDGPTQVILPLPDRSRLLGVCLGGKDQDTLFAFTSDKIWKRKVKVHGVGAFTPWQPARGSKL
ncbi:RICIN domain-containing protein [Telmatocola sphagniphila]|uniref:RICIN domain-containing protein n=1 Tax=Telmatocola sphagniphila TaxID=1123043 RepID=A0A8E6B9C7_9BACT|nr:RICIN domain-containing protein [Telmatocola sphagniphila]QVL33546.1 RICIN domain-containing protein [Telmatocola sphagniphila]